jgi:ABC-type Zn uptake system ZnuABC Zn-binding protein ZnuA
MKFEKHDITLRRMKFDDVLIEDLTDGELKDIVKQMEAELEEISSRRNLMGSVHLFGYLLLDYAMRLYKIEHFEKGKQKAEEKRLDETLKRLEDFLKNP